ncbi:MAG: ATP-binding protein [Treponema sp.]
MEINRKIYKKLLRWKNELAGEKALMLEGARRIGKSTVAENFAKNEYASYILIDFNIASKKIKDNFENLTDLDTFYQTLSIEYKTKLYPRNSIIIFGEIQKFPRAREAIKYLVRDRRFDFIETGSLISIRENVQDITIPSEERKLKMYPVDFEEFAEARGERVLLDYIYECYRKKIPLDQKFHARAMRLLREYMLVGGMPQSIVAYIENGLDFEKSDAEKRDILNLYRDDIKKAARRYNSKVSALFENVPAFLSTHEKKIVLSEIDKGATFDRYDDPLFWLGDSMICNLCYKCNDPCVGFGLNKNTSAIKCYMGDTGLLVSLAFSENEIASTQLYKSIMDGKLSLNEGMIYENLVSQMIACGGHELYFYTQYNQEKHRNDIEIDFLLSNESKTNFKIYPFEVKSSKNYTTTSLTGFKSKFAKKIESSYIVHPKNFAAADGVTKIPPYMLISLFQ